MDILNKTYQFIELDYLTNTCANDSGMMKMIIKMFLDKTPSLILSLNEVVSEGNWDEANRISHKLKSSFLTFGSKEAGHLLETIESMTNEENIGSSEYSFSSLGKIMNDFNKLSQVVIEELNSVLPSLEN